MGQRIIAVPFPPARTVRSAVSLHVVCLKRRRRQEGCAAPPATALDHVARHAAQQHVLGLAPHRWREREREGRRKVGCLARIYFETWRVKT